MTDPDAAPTTLSVAPSASASAPVTVPALPANLPSRIYPAETIAQPEAGYTLISLLFDGNLPWYFVANQADSQGQIFSWLPVVLWNALGITSDEVKTFALQVYIPSTYQSTADVGQLRTMWLAYIPSSNVSSLASLVSTQKSKLYTGVPDPYATLASHIDPAFSVDTVSVTAGTGSSSSSGSSAASTTGGSSNNSRQDAIIGVVSALGGLTLIILAVLVYRAVKKRRELAHRRLSDPNIPNDPYPDRAGRDFDQDSIGGPRRRSFYFAEDSLRGTSVQPSGVQTQHPAMGEVEYSYRHSPENMRERRPVMPGAISAPILQQSSMNW